MQFDPSWDLFIIIFFAVVLAYSFIIGRDGTLKIIIGTYIATLTADGIGNLLQTYVFKGGEVGGKIISVNLPEQSLQTLVLAKIIIFVLIIVLLSIRGRFFINVPKESNPAISFLMTAVFGVLSAGLLVSTILVYAGGGSFMEGAGSLSGQMKTVYDGSTLVRLMFDGYSFWFSLPALAFLLASVVAGGGDSEE